MTVTVQNGVQTISTTLDTAVVIQEMKPTTKSSARYVALRLHQRVPSGSLYSSVLTVDASLSVAWIRKEEIRTDETYEFWVVASSEYLSHPLYPEEMRELAHWHWDTKNDGYKAMNQHVHTKRIYPHNSNASAAILLILFMVFDLLIVYLHDYQERLTNYPGMKQTRIFALRMTRWLIIGAAFRDYW